MLAFHPFNGVFDLKTEIHRMNELINGFGLHAVRWMTVGAVVSVVMMRILLMTMLMETQFRLHELGLMNEVPGSVT